MRKKKSLLISLVMCILLAFTPVYAEDSETEVDSATILQPLFQELILLVQFLRSKFRNRRRIPFSNQIKKGKNSYGIYLHYRTCQIKNFWF